MQLPSGCKKTFVELRAEAEKFPQRFQRAGRGPFILLVGSRSRE